MRSEDEIRADATDERPFSNGSEFDLWADRFCYNECVHDDADREIYCPILNVALLGQAGNGAWPKEWTRKYLKFGPLVDGTDRRQPIPTTADDPEGCLYVDACTEYEQRRDPGPGDPDRLPDPPPVCEGQLDIIDVYLPDAIEELAQAPAGPVATPTGGRYLVTRTGVDGTVDEAFVTTAAGLIAAALEVEQP